ncbi:MAG: MlaD family protein, partial [Kofleriaceae bacterium]
MSELDRESLPAPTVHKRKRGRPSAVWIVPIVAILAAGALAIRTYLRLGPTIYITFENAEGIEAGKSEVRYKNVPVGKVTSVELSEDRKHIVATVKLTHGAAHIASEDSQFWVERPRIGVGGISGLGTLLSGAYIGVDVGMATKDRSAFTGLEKPPGITHDQPGTRFRLNTGDAGSLGVQSPIYMRRQSVGAITSLALSADGKSIELEIFVASPYDHLVTENSSGLDVTIDASGLRLETQSLATVVAGGIALGVREGAPPGKPAPEGKVFHLYEDRRHALSKPDEDGLQLALRFDQPIRGTGIGVNVEFEGVHVGEVTDVRPGYDAATHAFFFDVDALVYPARLGAAYTALVDEGKQTGQTGPQMLQVLVQRGLRAQIKSSNFLTGSYYIDLEFVPGKGATTVAARDGVWVVPTLKNSTD